MKNIVLDIESYYDQQVSLKKLSTLEYVRHPKFKVHGAAVWMSDDEPKWLLDHELRDLFAQLDWPSWRAISHNANFDMLVLAEHYGVIPGQRVDTLGLCRSLLCQDLNFDLDTIAPLMGGTAKLGGGKALGDVEGVENPSQEQLDRLGEYAIDDAKNCALIFDKLWPSLPKKERIYHDIVVRMSTVGAFVGGEATQAALDATRNEIETDRRAKLDACPSGITPEMLRSRDVFAKLLRERGVEPPTKKSPRTGQETYAFAKDDPEFVALKADPQVSDLVQAKMVFASNTAITRVERLSRIFARPPYTLPVQLQVSGAHTHRLSGGGKINMQNLNARGVGKSLRQAIRAHEGCVIHVRDLSGIELRVNMMYSGQMDVVDLIRAGGDVYVREAAQQFNVPESEVTPHQRQVGKAIQLGCGFRMGSTRFRTYMAAGPIGMDPIHMTEAEASETISIYRATNDQVAGKWAWHDQVSIPFMAHAKPGDTLEDGPVTFVNEGVILPGGLRLHYPNLDIDEQGQWTWGENGVLHFLHGGLLQENIVQAVAGQIMKEHIVKIDRRLNGTPFLETYLEHVRAGKPFRDERRQGAVVHAVHDEALAISTLDDAEYVHNTMREVMETPPKWWPDLPLDTEGGWDVCYSK